MSEIWRVVRYVDGKRTPIFVRHGFIRRTIYKTQKDRVIIESHETEEAANEAAKKHHGSVVERERIRADLDG